MTRHTATIARRLRRLVSVMVLVGAGSLVWVAPAPAQPRSSITTPDSAGDVGAHTSLVRDASGNPVVSYRDNAGGNLKVMHCNDPNCAGGNESITSPDTAGDVGSFTSLALDSAGNPVVSYLDVTNGDLKILHCNDVNCAGGNESTTSPDTAGFVGAFTSLTLDSAGNPVVSYADVTNNALKIMHCNDANCAGDDESITSPDTGVFPVPGQSLPLALDAAGNPVVAYHGGNSLRVLHCNDPNCVDGDESISVADPGIILGRHASLVLDAAGNPVIGYNNTSGGALRVMHCNDANCVGGNESITNHRPGGIVGEYTSLRLDSAGNPVVSHYASTTDDLVVMHCNDPNCAGGDESIVSPDTAGDVGAYTSLRLDGAGNPVVSYYDVTNGDLKILHCATPGCLPDTTAPVTSIVLSPAAPNGSNGWYVSPVSVSVGTADADAVETRCVLDPATPPVSFDALPAGPCAIGTVAAEGSHVVYAASIDDLGNAEVPVSATFSIDQTPPTTTMSLSPPAPDGANGWYVSPVTVTVAGADTNPVETRCVLDPPVPPAGFDDLPAGPCTVAEVGTDGAHTVYAATIDEAGNRGSMVETSFRIDRTLPVTGIEVAPAEPDGENGWYVSPVSVTVISSDIDVVETRCVLDPPFPPRSFDEIPGGGCAIGVVDTDGGHTVYAAAVDEAGNRATVVERTFAIDRTAPSTRILLSPTEPDGENGWYVSPVTVNILSDDVDVVETRCVLDPATAPLTFEDLPAAPCDIGEVAGGWTHRVFAASMDDAGNTETPVERVFLVAESVDATTIAVNPVEPDGADGWYVSDVAVAVIGPDGTDTRCAVNPGTLPTGYDDLPEEPCALVTQPANPTTSVAGSAAELAQLAELDDGIYLIYAASRHPSGVTSDLVEVTVRVDRTAPELNAFVTPDPVTVGGTAVVNIDADDATSGIAMARCDTPDTTEVGDKTLACSASDFAGHTTEITVAYRVVASPGDPSGDPLDDPPAASGGGASGEGLPATGIGARHLINFSVLCLVAGSALLVAAHVSPSRRRRHRQERCPLCQPWATNG